jgi:hypothetical protein
MVKYDESSIRELAGRLYNWKFMSAQVLPIVPKLPLDLRNRTRALSMCFSDSGWFTGSMGQIVHDAVNSLIMDIETLTGVKLNDYRD